MSTNGFAAPAEEEMADTISIGEFLLRNKEASYILEVEHNWLADSGICAGDMIIFERNFDYKDGDVVVSLDAEGYHLNYWPLKRDEGKVEEVVGVVVSSFRRYKK